MGVKELLTAFNAEAAPDYSAASATLHYEQGSGGESQILTFSGTSVGGEPFLVKSEPLGRQVDVNQAARTVAAKLKGKAP